MAANTSAIFSRVGDIQWFTAAVVTGNITTDLTTGATHLIFTADVTNGGRIEKVRFQPLGTNVATVGRIWINNGLTVATAANNTQIADVTLPATTVSQVAAIGAVDVILDLALPPGYTLIVTIGTTVAAGFKVTAFGGKY